MPYKHSNLVLQAAKVAPTIQFSGEVPSDIFELHSYVAPCRLNEALDLVKEMARSHRYMQAATLNSLVRALAPSSAPRALRMVSFMTTLGLPTYHVTSIALIGACARQHMSAESLDLYWYVASPVQRDVHDVGISVFKLGLASIDRHIHDAYHSCMTRASVELWRLWPLLYLRCPTSFCGS